MSKKSYYNKALLSDFLTFWAEYCPRSIATGTAMTDPKILTGEKIPDGLPEQRALAIGYALCGERHDWVTKLMLENQSDVCFQLYGLFCEGLKEILNVILARKDLTLEEINLLLYFVMSGRFTFDSKRNKQYCRLLYYKAEKLVEENHNLMMTEIFRIVLELPKEIPFFRNFWKLLSCDYYCAAHAVEFFEKREITLAELRHVLAVQDFSLDGIDTVIIERLLQTRNEWTPDEIKFLTDNVGKLKWARNRIVKLQNYRRLGNTLGYLGCPRIYMLGVRDQYAYEKLSLFTENQQIQILTATLKMQPITARFLPVVFQGLLQKTFHTWDEDLLGAWDACWDQLDGCYNGKYLVSSVCSEEAAEKFISELTYDNAELFLDFIGNRKVQEGLLELCRKTGEFNLLSDFTVFFNAKEQKEILHMLKIVDSGRNPNLPKGARTHNLPLSLQVFANDIGASFSRLSEEDKKFVASAIRQFNTGGQKLTEEMVINTLQKTKSITIYREQIFRSALRFGVEFVDNYYKYFVDCKGYEKNLDPKIVCSAFFKYRTAENTVEDAKISRGRAFKRTHDSYEEFNDNTLDFFQWCGTDEYWSDHHNINETLGHKKTDYAKFFVKSVFHKDIDSWEIKQNSPLLDSSFLLKVDWKRNQRWLCESYSADLLNPPVPDEVIPIIHGSYSLGAIAKNLSRHDYSWYQGWNNWKAILHYNFEWDEFTCFYSKQVMASGTHTRESFMQYLYHKAGYELTLSDPDAAVLSIK